MSILSIEMEAKNHERNHFRFYRVDVQKDLFNYWMVTTIYGRIGTKGTTKKFAFKNIKEVENKIKDVLNRRKTARKRIGTDYNIKERYDPHGLLKAA